MKKWFPICCLALAFGCVGAPQQPERALESSELLTESRLQLDLPQRYQHWRDDFLADWQDVQRLMNQLAGRWPETKGAPNSLKLTITASPPEAQFLSDRLSLPGDPQVPRTHPTRRLALITLPRDDRLLADMPHPPRTLRETARHEMAHLLACDRPGMASAPAWFHEGLAEAVVGLQPTPFPDFTQSLFGSSWVSRLRASRQKYGEVYLDLHRVLEEQAAEIRYSVWACLVQQLLQKVSGPAPWTHAFAKPSLTTFFATLPAGYGDEDPVPLPRGREIDFVLGGKYVMLASLPLESVVLHAGTWSGEQALDLKMRVGRTGAAMAGFLLRSDADPSQVMRVRMNTFGAAVASLETMKHPNSRAYQSRSQPGAVADWREFSVALQDGADGSPQLQVSSREYKRTFSANFSPPYKLEFYVIDGACEIRGQQTLLPPDNHSLR